ncbi:MAG: DNA gyrase subunit A [Planctomycetota bacterium]|nr:DNA gyrase subunit A [Planctomycetota bacterium]
MADTPPPAVDPAAPLVPQPLDIADELRDSYLTYAMSVIVSRALPDARDGLKPSQRRILVAMHDLNLGPSSATSKCAGIVGETMKRYHPHGEQVIYPTLVRMAQDWNMRHRLVHSQGNFGSIAGLPPAAMRYTEARLTPISALMLDDLESETVDFIDNYDGKYREPLVLPSRFPNLLVNGSDGIAVGMATEIPPHNLGEVCDAAILLIDEPSSSITRLMEVIPGPDYPTGGIICGRQGILEGYTTGRGRVTLRARAHVHQEGRQQQVIITEVPYQQTRNRLAENIGELVKNERIRGISSIRDESSQRTGEPVRLVLDIKRDADPHFVLNQLYQYSPLERTASIILLALVDGRPRLLTIKELIECFLKHRVEVISRRTQFLLRKAKERCHVLEGQLIAISSLDEVIAICRASPSRQEAKARLTSMAVSAAVLERALGSQGFEALQRELGALPEYRMTDNQADAVVRLQLGQLAALERDEILREFQGLRGDIHRYETLLSDDRNILALVRDDLVLLRDRHSDKRRTEITGEEARLNREDLIEEQEMAVTLSHNGYIKRMALDTFRAQNRGGRGVSGGTTREEDFIERFFSASTHAYLLCFTNRGQIYWLKVYDIPEGSRVAQGRSIVNVLSLREGEKIQSLFTVRDFAAFKEHSLIIATKNGLVKKTPLQEYSRPRTSGIIGINLREGDALVSVVLVKPTDEVMLVSKNGMALRFDESDARDVGRNSTGVRGIRLMEGDEVVGLVVADPEGQLLTVCENGYGKRTPFGANSGGALPPEGEEAEEAESPAAPEVVIVAEVAENSEEAGEGEEAAPSSSYRYRLQRRGGKGVRDIRIEGRNGPVIAVAAVREGQDVVIVTKNGMVNRSFAEQIRQCGRNSKGVRLINLKADDRVVSVAVVGRDATVPDEAIDGAPVPETPSGEA